MSQNHIRYNSLWSTPVPPPQDVLSLCMQIKHSSANLYLWLILTLTHVWIKNVGPGTERYLAGPQPSLLSQSRHGAVWICSQVYLFQTRGRQVIVRNHCHFKKNKYHTTWFLAVWPRSPREAKQKWLRVEVVFRNKDYVHGIYFWKVVQ